MQGARSYDSPFSNWDSNRSRESFARAEAAGADERYGNEDEGEGAGRAETSAMATLRTIPAAHPAHAHGGLPPLPGTNKVSSFEMPGLFEADHNDFPKGRGVNTSSEGDGEGIDRQTDDGDRAADHHGQKHDRRHHHHHQ